VTGHPLLWRQERNRTAVDLGLLLDDDELLRGQSGRVQVQVQSELTFGMREHAAVRVGLPDGREIWFRDSADRATAPGARSWWSITRPAALEVQGCCMS
jgi:hypothetical protein